jgi:thioredoxin reductase (NADPH)
MAAQNRAVAMVIADQSVGEMSGIDFLGRSRDVAADAKRVLLTEYSGIDAAVDAIDGVGLDYYLLKPLDPFELRVFPSLEDLLGDWRAVHPPETTGVRVVGHRWSERSYDIKTFLARNHVPYEWLDLERDEEAMHLQGDLGAHLEDLPLVVVPGHRTLRAPTTLDLADALELGTHATQPLYDLCIVGAGPAGLAAAVYGASEGLRCVVVEREAPGGQAGQSAAIENYLGFPHGLSGDELTVRAVAQVRRFGAEMVVAHDVASFEINEPVRTIRFDDGSTVDARAMVLATGVAYRMLEAPGVSSFTGRGVYYGATASETSATDGEEVVVVGAANSAGQAVVNLSRHASKVVLLVRSDALEKSMSRYLIDRIAAADNVQVRLCTEIGEAHGTDHLEALTLVDRETGATDKIDVNWLFAYIGASPRTDWLGGAVLRDDKGFIVTGPDLETIGGEDHWPLARPPAALETSVPGVFAAGDVRLGSMKRVAAAVGEGAMAGFQALGYVASL